MMLASPEESYNNVLSLILSLFIFFCPAVSKLKTPRMKPIMQGSIKVF